MHYNRKKFLINLNRKVKLGYWKLISNTLKKYNYEPLDNIRPSDIVMAGYPKSGNTWMQNLLAGLIYGIDTHYLPDKLTQELIPDLDYKLFFKRMGNEMCFKTHDLPSPKFRKVIHLIRDPRDVMASYYAMVKGRGKNVSQRSLIVDNEEMLFGNWHNHTNAWRDNPYKAEILLVRYEDLISDTSNEIKRILNFIGLERTNDTINRAIAGNSIIEMKKKEALYGFDKQFINKENWVEGHTFVRNGQKGGGKKELEPELVDFILSKNKDLLNYYKYL